MKVVNPIGRSAQQVGGGTVEPMGCTCNSQLNNMTSVRKTAGSCSSCLASCVGDANGHANGAIARDKRRY